MGACTALSQREQLQYDALAQREDHSWKGDESEIQAQYKSGSDVSKTDDWHPNIFGLRLETKQAATQTPRIKLVARSPELIKWC